MIRTEKEMTREFKEKLRGGEGRVEMLHLFQQQEMDGKCRVFAKLTLPPGCSIGSHPHNDEEEIYYILSGTATADDNGTPVTLKAGDTMKTGGGKSHAISNNSSEPLVFMAVVLLF